MKAMVAKISRLGQVHLLPAAMILNWRGQLQNPSVSLIKSKERLMNWSRQCNPSSLSSHVEFCADKIKVCDLHHWRFLSRPSLYR